MVTENPAANPLAGLLTRCDAPPGVSAQSKAEARSWAPNTRKAYVAAWNDFTRWCLDNRCPGLPSAAAAVRYLEDLVDLFKETVGTEARDRRRLGTAVEVPPAGRSLHRLREKGG